MIRNAALRMGALTRLSAAVMPKRTYVPNEVGSGEGRGGGTGGSIKSAGGSFGKREQAIEEQYFRKKNAEELKDIHDHPEHLKKPEKPAQEKAPKKK